MSDADRILNMLQELGELKQFVVSLRLCFDGKRTPEEILADVRKRIGWQLGQKVDDKE